MTRMKPRYILRKQRRAATRWAGKCAALVLCHGFSAKANPQGLTVVAGNATLQSTAGQLSVTVGQTAVLNWNSFNIQKGQTTTFLQPSANSVVLNEINGIAPSQIWGNLNANGTVILANSHGFYFGPGSMIQVGGSFVATTAPILPDPGAGSAWQFTGMPPLASIINYGGIQVGNGRSLYLIAQQIENHGQLTAPQGGVGLLAAGQVMLSEQPDGRGLTSVVNLPSGAVDNTGKITADAGTIALHAQVVNQNGVLQADSVREQNGVIELVAGSLINLGAESQILARGGPGGPSQGGNITLQSGGSLTGATGSRVNASGGPAGGNGGAIEVSAPNIVSLPAALTAEARPGWSAGKLLLDPEEIILSTSGSGSAGNGTIASGDGSGTLQLNVNSAFMNLAFSQITLQALDNITFAPGTVWNLSASTGRNQGLLELQAGDNILFGKNSGLVDGNGWSVNLQAGVNFTTGQVTAGTGSILLNGGPGNNFNAGVKTSSGGITMTAGQDILVGTGYISTSGGGGVSLQALAGDINAGTKNDGYIFTSQGYSVSPSGLGGITTAAGGDVSLTAGGNVISIPTTPAGQAPGASGAYGSAPGDVTIVAGGNILGNYLVRNGTGTLLAGVAASGGSTPQVVNPQSSIGTVTQPDSLSLVSGAWNVQAGGDVYINEVRNPNGTFNSNRLPVPVGEFPGNIGPTGDTAPPSRGTFLFDYAPNASVSIWAGDSITLEGQNLPRVAGANQYMPPVYPPQLTLDAGAGGVSIQNSIVLYPSSQGSLSITTRNGGVLQGAPQQGALTSITMSDSGLPDYNTFALGQALTPLHLANPQPVTLGVSGDLDNLGLVVPTFATINVAGSAYNFGFSGRNLSPAQTTSINIAGDLNYRGDTTSVTFPGIFPAALLDAALSSDPEVAQKLLFNPVTGKLTFIGQMTQSEFGFLQNPTALVLDPYGQPVLNSSGNPVTTPVALTPAQAAAIQQLYTATQNASLGDWGLTLSGPGQFNITARNADLGVSGGISVQPPGTAAAAISPNGAALNIKLSGNLEMTASQISNGGLLGSIQLQAGGVLDVGGQLSAFGDPNAPKGIFTTSGGAVTITAGGDVNLDGSRVAAYNGGNVSVTSQNGSVDAGSGGAGYVSFSSVALDPSTGLLVTTAATIPGSGILATTLPGSAAGLGNISVSTPHGGINASAGGITQIAFNHADTSDNFIQLDAGGDINAAGSGIIGSNIRLNAGGNISGVVVGSGNVSIQAVQSVSVAAFAGGGVTIGAGGSVSGSVISGGNASVSGESINASLVSRSVTTSGDMTGSTTGVPASNVAKTDARVADDTDTVSGKSLAPASADDDEKKKNARRVTLSRKTGRVTVILPPGK